PDLLEVPGSAHYHSGYIGVEDILHPGLLDMGRRTSRNGNGPERVILPGSGFVVEFGEGLDPVGVHYLFLALMAVRVDQVRLPVGHEAVPVLINTPQVGEGV